MVIKFNQELDVPDVIKAAKVVDKKRRLGIADETVVNKDGKRRRLVGMADIVPSEFIDLSLVQKDGEPSAAGFTASLGVWTEKGMELKMAFKDPLSISSGGAND